MHAAFFRIDPAVDLVSLRNKLTTILGNHGVKSAESVTEALLSDLRQTQAGSLEFACPFPLVCSPRAAHTQAKHLHRALGKEVSLGKAMEIFAEIFGFRMWQSFIVAVEEFFGPQPILTAPVLKAKNWRYLLRDLGNRRETSYMSSLMRQEDLKLLLASPAGVAFWIAKYLPALAELECLRILVFETIDMDIFDNGMWFGFIPALLGKTIQIRVTIVGEHIEYHKTPYESLLRKQKLPIETSCLKMGVADFFADNSLSQFDLVYTHDPNLGNPEQTEFLTKILRTNVPLLAGAMAPAHHLFTKAMLEASGFGVGEPQFCPFGAEAEENDSNEEPRVGKVLRQLLPLSADAEPSVDQQKMDDLNDLMLALLSAAEKGQNFTIEDAGQQHVVKRGDLSVPVIHVWGTLYLDLATREILDYSQQHGPTALGTGLYLTPKEIHSFPGEDGDAVQRAIWCMNIKNKRIAPFYSERKKLLEDARERAKEHLGSDLPPLGALQSDMFDEMPSMMVSLMLQSEAPLEYVYAYLKTARFVTEMNKEYLAPEEWKEWKMAIKEARNLLPEGKGLQKRVNGLKELNEEGAPLYVQFIWLATGVVKEPGIRLSPSQEQSWQKAAQEWDRIYNLYYSTTPALKRPR